MSFYQEVLNLCKKIPRGKVTTYKILAEKLGTKAYRAVGTALKNNPYAPIVPCHRVVKSNGQVGHYSGQGGVKKKIQLLKDEGVEICQGKIDLRKYAWQ